MIQEQKMFNKDFYINNRKKLYSSTNDSTIIIAGNGLVQSSADNAHSFRQDSNFYYLTGISEPNLFLILDSKNNKEYICYKQKTDIAKLFDGEYDFNEYAKSSGIAEFLEYKSAYNMIINLKTKKVFFNFPNKKYDVIYNNPHQGYILNKIKKFRIEAESINEILAELRCIKQPLEIDSISRAVKITKQVIQSATIDLESYNNEKEILDKINIDFIKNSVKHGYAPMVAGGIRSTTAHYSKNNANLKSEDTLLLDIGAEYNRYTADISRTFVIGENKFKTGLINEIYEIQKNLISLLKPGIYFKDIHKSAVEQITDLLLRNSFIKNKNDYVKYFPYSIGHFLGLDVHDVGNYQNPLKPNMILTIEPGIHIPEKQFGIRIEDDILITDTGSRVL